MTRHLLLYIIFPLLCSWVQMLHAGSRPVVLDIGHFIGSGGAVMPAAINGKRIGECSFWYQYSYDVKKAIEEGGYKCIVTNRGNAPTTEPLMSYAKRAGVVQLNHPDVNAERYPSKYHPDRVASGIVSSDFAISKDAACIVFLHHNSTAHRWTRGPSATRSLILCNRYNGHTLAETLCQVLNEEILNKLIPNGGMLCQVEERYVDADRSAGWLNACDDSGIPAVVIEATYLNNRDHAAFLVQDANARLYARTIGKAVVRYLKEHGKDPRHLRENEDEPDEGSFGYAEESRKLDVPGAKRLLP